MTFALTVAALDLLQVVLLSWRPKHWGALAGAALYLFLALGAARRWRPALAVLAAMPLVPLAVLAATAAGAALPVAPDAAMIGILAVQLAAAAAAGVALRRA